MSRLVAVSLIDPSPWASLFPHDAEHVARLADDIRERGITTPLHVYARGERYELLAGHDRLAAAKQLGLTEVPVDERLLPNEDDRFLYFIADNTLRKTVDRRTLATALLKRWPNRSDRAIADIVGCDGKTVAVVRDELTGRAEIPHVAERTDTAGRSQPAHKPSVVRARVVVEPTPEPERTIAHVRVSEGERSPAPSVIEDDEEQGIDVAAQMKQHRREYASAAITRLEKLLLAQPADSRPYADAELDDAVFSPRFHVGLEKTAIETHALLARVVERIHRKHSEASRVSA